MKKPNIAEMQKFERLRRMNDLLASIQACEKQNVTADKEKVIGTYCLAWGCSRRTLLEYLRTLESAGKIEIKPNGMVLR